MMASCRADRPSAWAFSGVQELRRAHPWAVSGEWWVTFEHRYQTVLESSQEIQHCPVRCPQRPRCASAQSQAAPTASQGGSGGPARTQCSERPGLCLGWTRPARERFRDPETTLSVQSKGTWGCWPGTQAGGCMLTCPPWTQEERGLELAAFPGSVHSSQFWVAAPGVRPSGPRLSLCSPEPFVSPSPHLPGVAAAPARAPWAGPGYLSVLIRTTLWGEVPPMQLLAAFIPGLKDSQRHLPKVRFLPTQKPPK